MLISFWTKFKYFFFLLHFRIILPPKIFNFNWNFLLFKRNSHLNCMQQELARFLHASNWKGRVYGQTYGPGSSCLQFECIVKNDSYVHLWAQIKHKLLSTDFKREVAISFVKVFLHYYSKSKRKSYGSHNLRMYLHM